MLLWRITDRERERRKLKRVSLFPQTVSPLPAALPWWLFPCLWCNRPSPERAGEMGTFEGRFAGFWSVFHLFPAHFPPSGKSSHLNDTWSPEKKRTQLNTDTLTQPSLRKEAGILFWIIERSQYNRIIDCSLYCFPKQMQIRPSRALGPKARRQWLCSFFTGPGTHFRAFLFYTPLPVYGSHFQASLSVEKHGFMWTSEQTSLSGSSIPLHSSSLIWQTLQLSLSETLLPPHW